MSKRLELRILGPSAAWTQTFSVEGEWRPSIRPVYKDAANPPQLTELRHTWTFNGCRIVSTDGTTDTLWDQLTTFFGRFENRSSHPEKVQLVRDPSGAAEVLLTLGPSTYEQFRVEAIDPVTDELVPSASWNTVGAFNLVVSAVRKFADANGICGFEQTVKVSYPAGLQRVEWVTTITTAEGTSALTKAQTYATIDATDYGSAYAYVADTNGPNGIAYEITDADEVNSRTPTVCVARSAVQQSAISLGVTSQQGSPSDFIYTVTTVTTATEEVTTTEAAASGPNALTWVTSKKPGGSIDSAEIVNEQAARTVRGTWIQRRQLGDPTDKGRSIAIRVSGGARVRAFRVASGSALPIEQVGGYTPWRADITIMVRRRGGNGLASELPFPPMLKRPWIYDQNASQEGWPERLEWGVDPSQDLWQREASLVYWASTPPRGSILAELETSGGRPVASYNGMES